jgi:peptidoglycan/xylan/chitin deacetylase (PgdA/CDA1 family)
MRKHKDKWPIDPANKKYPEFWTGWPEKKKFALVLTHDVESLNGLRKCRKLADIEKKHGFRSGFYFVPEKYKIPATLRENLIDDGFEVGVHGLNHDGRLFFSRNIFNERAERINFYLKEWQASGFRAPAMHHNLNWIQNLNIDYDLSTFEFDPFEPQNDGVHTIFPFLVNGQDGYVEMPYTLPQDSTLFLMLKNKTIDLWKRKLDWLVKNGGMALLITHPDYMYFEKNKTPLYQYPAKLYEEFLTYIREKYDGAYWHILPKEMAPFWKNLYKSKSFNNGHFEKG